MDPADQKQPVSASDAAPSGDGAGQKHGTDAIHATGPAEPRLSRQTSASPSDALSLSGLLSGMAAVGLMFAWWKFPAFSANWNSTVLMAFAGVVLVLVAWSVWQSLPARGPRTPRPVARLSRNRVRLPQPGLMYLGMMVVMFLGAMLGRSNVLMLLFSLMAGPFVLNGWITFSMLRHLKVRRTVPRQAMAGEQVSVSVEVTNGKHVIPGWLIQVEDSIQSRHEKLLGHVLFTRLPARQSRTASFALRLMRRGVYRFSRLQATTRFPFGLIERGLMFQGPEHEAELLVYPRTGTLSQTWKQETLTAAELVERQEPRRGTWNDEFHRIREFRWGDNPRAIHWRTSARMNELMVREFQQNRDQDLVLLLDLWCPAHGTNREQERAELAVSFAATVALAHLTDSRHARSLLAVAGREFHELEGDCGPLLQDPLLECLAVVEAAPDPDVARLLELARSRRTASARMVLITTRSRDAAVALLDGSAAEGASPGTASAASPATDRSGDGRPQPQAGGGTSPAAIAPVPGLTDLAVVSTAEDSFSSIFQLQ